FKFEKSSLLTSCIVPNDAIFFMNFDQKYDWVSKKYESYASNGVIAFICWLKLLVLVTNVFFPILAIQVTNIEPPETILALCCPFRDNFFAVSVFINDFISEGVTHCIPLSE